jgi:hypothetical protein
VTPSAAGDHVTCTDAESPGVHETTDAAAPVGVASAAELIVRLSDADDPNPATACAAGTSAATPAATEP